MKAFKTEDCQSRLPNQHQVPSSTAQITCRWHVGTEVAQINKRIINFELKPKLLDTRKQGYRGEMHLEDWRNKTDSATTQKKKQRRHSSEHGTVRPTASDRQDGHLEKCASEDTREKEKEHPDDKGRLERAVRPVQDLQIGLQLT